MLDAPGTRINQGARLDDRWREDEPMRCICSRRDSSPLDPASARGTPHDDRADRGAVPAPRQRQSYLPVRTLSPMIGALVKRGSSPDGAMRRATDSDTGGVPCVASFSSP